MQPINFNIIKIIIPPTINPQQPPEELELLLLFPPRLYPCGVRVYILVFSRPFA